MLGASDETVYGTVKDCALERAKRCGGHFPKDGNLLTSSMQQRPSSEANSFSASQEIPRTLWNPEAHYRNHNRPPPVPILGQIIFAKIVSVSFFEQLILILIFF